MKKPEPESYDINDVENPDDLYERLEVESVGDPDALVESGWLLDEEKSRYVRPSPVTVALAFSAPYAGLNAITSSNWEEWCYRLAVLHDAGYGFRHVETPDGRVPLPFTAAQIRRHLGMKITFPSSSLLSDEAFDLKMGIVRRRELAKKIQRGEE